VIAVVGAVATALMGVAALAAIGALLVLLADPRVYRGRHR
jgi:hypothetical protein